MNVSSLHSILLEYTSPSKTSEIIVVATILVNWMVSNAWYPCATFYNTKILSLLLVMPRMANCNIKTPCVLLRTNIKWYHATEIALDNKMLGACCYTPNINGVST